MADKYDVQLIRTLVRTREDLQRQRINIDNRLGRKASGESQEIEERMIRPEDMVLVMEHADMLRKQEAAVEKQLKKLLKRFPVYNEFLKDVKGAGPVVCGWIVGEIDIEKANAVSNIWSFAGMNPGLVYGKKRVENKDGTYSFVTTDKMVRGDKLSKGFVAPFNGNLRRVLLGLLGPGFIKAKSPYRKLYDDYKTRLENSDQITTETKAGGKIVEIPWKDATKNHRHMAAIRFMVKQFLIDLYVA